MLRARDTARAELRLRLAAAAAAAAACTIQINWCIRNSDGGAK